MTTVAYVNEAAHAVAVRGWAMQAVRSIALHEADGCTFVDGAATIIAYRLNTMSLDELYGMTFERLADIVDEYEVLCPREGIDRRAEFELTV